MLIVKLGLIRPKVSISKGFGLFQQLRYNLSLRFTLTVVRRLKKTVSADPLSSRGINKLHLEGDFHLESDIEAIKVYQ